MEFARSHGIAYYRDPAWSALRHGIFTRQGGVSVGRFRSLNVGGVNGDEPAAVRENHRRMYAALDVARDRAVTAWLVHSVDVRVVEEARNGKPIQKADGLITNLPDVPLVMRFADCVPLLLYDPVKSAIGLGHAGWRGTVDGMAAHLVAAMSRAYGCQPDDMQALIGPAISRENYPVGEDVAAAAESRYGADSEVACLAPATNQMHLDLWRANELDLRRAGVGRIRTLRLCTADRVDQFFSHRAEQGKTGRFGVVMCL